MPPLESTSRSLGARSGTPGGPSVTVVMVPSLVALGDALAVTFSEQEFTVPCEREAVRTVGVLAHHRNLAAGIEIENLADPDVGEIETAVGGADWAFRENKAFLYKLWRGTWRQHARDTARR